MGPSPPPRRNAHIGVPRDTLPLLGVLASLALACLPLAHAAPFSYQLAARVIYHGKATFDGVYNPTIPASKPGRSVMSRRLASRLEPDTPSPGNSLHQGTARPAAVSATISAANPKLKANGISGATSAFAGVGKYKGTQGLYTPPDTTLCVGAGFVVQATNMAIEVRNATTLQLKAGIRALNQFFKLDPYRITKKGKFLGYGDILTEPDCVYDTSTKRFFLAVSWQPGNYSSALDKYGQTRVIGSKRVGGAGLLLAVSTAADPTKPWSVFFIPGTNDGIKSRNDRKAPLFYKKLTRKQGSPSITVDASAVSIACNQLDAATVALGSNIYTMSKALLLKERKNFASSRFAIPNNAIFKINLEAAKPAGDSSFDSRGKGTIYFASLPGRSLKVDRSTVRLWAVTNTSSFVSGKVAKLALRFRSVRTATWKNANDSVSQSPGPIPYGNSLGFKTPANLTVGPGRMHSVGLQGNRVVFAFSVAYQAIGTPGVAYGSVRTSFGATAASLTATLEFFNQFGVKGTSLLYPAIGMNKKRRILIGLSLVGSGRYPSAAYTYVNAKGQLEDSAVYISAIGFSPIDDFDGYQPERKGTARYGNKQAVAIDEKGGGWVGAEFVSGVRYRGINWATSVVKSNL